MEAGRGKGASEKAVNSLIEGSKVFDVIVEHKVGFFLRSHNGFFYRAACNAAAVWRGDFCLSVCLPVCLSVCLSVTRVDCDKTVERSVQIYIPYERTFILVF